MKILFVDACVRKKSRTRRLARYVLERMNGTVAEVNAASATKAITDESFILSRTKASERKDFSDPVFGPARQFAEADVIVIAAPYWDLSFPAVLKAYFEQINPIAGTEGLQRFADLLLREALIGTSKEQNAVLPLRSDLNYRVSLQG